MKTLKQYLPDILVIVIFAVISFAYFFPADIEGRILYHNDSSAGRGLGQEALEYRQATGEVTRWTNSAFGGMPTYQLSPSYDSTESLTFFENMYHLWMPDYVWYLFAYLLGFYIFLRAYDFRRSLAVLGSILWAFSTYFLIIIAAGHIWKVMALAYLPPMIAGVILAYRGKLLPGFIITAIFSAFEVHANHVQMTYYYLFIILFMVIAFFVEALKKKELPQFMRATAVCIAGAAIGIAINISNLYHTWEYSQNSMRGKGELVQKDTEHKSTSGLDRDYITQWSYGTGETFTLLVPNTKGGASIPMAMNEKTVEEGNPNFMPIYNQLGQYWGEQPGTSGPVYVGAFVLFLFVLGLFIVKGPMKWALLAATILSILLSWGKNFMPMTDFFIDYMPMYSKFRTVASILVIAEFTIPLLAMMALKKIVDEPDLLTEKIKYFYLSLALTAGVALLFALMPGAFFDTFISTSERHALGSLPAEYISPIMADLTSIRQSIFTADCWRSVVIIVIGALLLLFYKARKIQTLPMVAAIAVLCFVDLWQVNKRYLNDDMFIASTQRDMPQPMTNADKQILADKADCGDYRVLNFSTNTFNENGNATSYYHKSIGGYHPAKLRRYQELIETYIANEMHNVLPAVANSAGDMTKVNGDSICPILNMLNTRYFIVPLQDNVTVPIRNPYAFGSAWFVDDVKFAENANEEIEMLGKLDLHTVAVADKKFKDAIGNVTVSDDNATVKIVDYKPNHLTYDVNSDAGGVVVFSEVYYPGWEALIDGQKAEVARVNYLLRAVNVPAGKHKVELTFYPKSITVTETIAYVAYSLLAIVMVGLIVWNRRKKTAKKE